MYVNPLTEAIARSTNVDNHTNEDNNTAASMSAARNEDLASTMTGSVQLTPDNCPSTNLTTKKKSKNSKTG